MNGSPIGTVIDATRVVDEQGATLWEGTGLGFGRPGTILAMSRLVDDPAELRRLHERTGADAVDMESGVLAATGRLRGCVRAVSAIRRRSRSGRLAGRSRPRAVSSGRPRLRSRGILRLPPER